MSAFANPPIAPEDMGAGEALKLNATRDGWEAFTPGGAAVPSAAIDLGLSMTGAQSLERISYMPSDTMASFADVLQVGPWTIGASDQAVIPACVVGEDPYVLTVDPDHFYAIAATLVVSNADGSELIEIDAGTTLEATGQAVINFGGGSVARTVGDDLTWGGSGDAKVASAAGGTYTATLKVLVQPEG